MKDEYMSLAACDGFRKEFMNRVFGVQIDSTLETNERKLMNTYKYKF